LIFSMTVMSAGWRNPVLRQQTCVRRVQASGERGCARMRSGSSHERVLSGGCAAAGVPVQRLGAPCQGFCGKKQVRVSHCSRSHCGLGVEKWRSAAIKRVGGRCLLRAVLALGWTTMVGALDLGPDVANWKSAVETASPGTAISFRPGVYHGCNVAIPAGLAACYSFLTNHVHINISPDPGSKCHSL